MFLPMLAAAKKPHQNDDEYYAIIKQHLPLLVQPKEDGFRLLINEEHRARTRTLKPLPNKWIRQLIKSANLPYGFDGELVTCDSNFNRDNFNDIASKVMSQNGTPNFYYHVFDWYSPATYFYRYKPIEDWLRGRDLPIMVNLIPSTLVDTIEDIENKLGYWLSRGYEGIILRSPRGHYKQGRATQQEGTLFKIKPFEYSTAKIIDFIELMHNEDTSTQMNENLVPGNTLGSLLVTDIERGGCEFNIGSGFDSATRQRIWNDRNKYKGRLVKYKFQLNRTKKIKPITPIFIGFI